MAPEFVLFGLLICVFVSSKSAEDFNQQQTSSRPSIFKDEQSSKPIPQVFHLPEDDALHIVSQLTDKQGTQWKLEEFIDTRSGRATTKTSKSFVGGCQRTIHTDAKQNSLHSYTPYRCKSFTLEDRHNLGEPLLSVSYQQEMIVFGVLAYWLKATRLESYNYTLEEMDNKLQGKKMIMHKWSVSEGEHVVDLYFSDKYQTENPTKRYTLEMIKVRDGQISETYNIELIDYYISPEDGLEYLTVPAGYGCETSRTGLEQFERHFKDTTKIDMEATSTKYNLEDRYQRGLTDTMSVEFVHNKDYQLLSQLSTGRDIKTFTDYRLNVRYDIDLREGTCLLNNIDSNPTSKSWASIEFQNGLKLDINQDSVKELFITTENFFKTRVLDEKLRKVVYLEKSAENYRIVREYQYSDYSAWTLESVSKLVFEKDQLVELYYMNVIDKYFILSDEQVAKWMDISEECFIENEGKQSGHDYARVQINYPVLDKDLKILTDGNFNFERAFYSEFLPITGYKPFQLPRVEVQVKDSELVLRALLLDIPSISMVYNRFENTVLPNGQGSGTLEEGAVNLEHCAEQCRLNSCKAMTYCTKTHSCLMSSLVPKITELTGTMTCDTFILPAGSKLEALQNMRLSKVLSELQHMDYSPMELAQDDTDADSIDSDQLSVIDNNADRLENEMKKQRGSLYPSITARLYHDVIGYKVYHLIPNNFLIEDDPLNDLDGDVSDKIDDAVMRAFHHSLRRARYNVKVLEGNVRLTHLTYDQCALACLDGSCNSFSYCSTEMECILTDIYDIETNKNLISDESPDCIIVQKDYLSKFSQFSNIKRLSDGKENEPASNPSSCAHSCYLKSDYSCLSYDYCPGQTRGEPATCYYHNDRNSFRLDDSEDGSEFSERCDHYSRTYLADFISIEHREIVEDELARMDPEPFDGRSPDECAQKCIDESQCSAFQFCFKADSTPKQKCTLIHRQPTVDSTIVKDKDRIMSLSKLYKSSINCYIFGFRNNTIESRSQALNIELEVSNSSSGSGSKSIQELSGGMSVMGAFMLFVSMTVVFALVGAAFSYAKHRNDNLRIKLEQLQTRLRFWRR